MYAVDNKGDLKEIKVEEYIKEICTLYSIYL